MSRSMQTSPTVRLPRLIVPQLQLSDIPLHVFCDALQDAMATCIYFRTLGSSGLHLTFFDWQNEGSTIKPREHSETGITSHQYGHMAVPVH